MTLLDVKNLSVWLDQTESQTEIVRDVSFTIGKREIVGLLGESGSGKSLTAMAALGLLPRTMQASGQILFGDTDLLTLSEPELCRRRGNDITIVFQEPLTALNPAQTIGRQVAEPLRMHKGLSRRQAAKEAVELLAHVGLPRPNELAAGHPHQLSGGQRQRVVIAIALACEPSLLIADEPTTALDTLVQRQIMDLLVGLVEETHAAMLLITHDVGLMAETADRVEVMYGGAIAESGPVEDILSHPRHPYTQMLLEALPQTSAETGRPLKPIPGTVPPPSARPDGCCFRDRCRESSPECVEPPQLQMVGSCHRAACVKLGTVAP